MRTERGFTLLEVLVAFIIAALALAVLFRGVSEGLKAVQVADGYNQALSRARSRLDGASSALAAGEQSGDDGGGFRWRVRIVQVTFIPAPGASAGAGAGAGGLPPPRLVLYDVSVAVSWQSDGQARRVELESQRLGYSRPEAP